jgi:hypothetical protein
MFCLFFPRHQQRPADGRWRGAASASRRMGMARTEHLACQSCFLPKELAGGVLKKNFLAS